MRLSRARAVALHYALARVRNAVMRACVYTLGRYEVMRACMYALARSDALRSDVLAAEILRGLTDSLTVYLAKR